MPMPRTLWSCMLIAGAAGFGSPVLLAQDSIPNTERLEIQPALNQKDPGPSEIFGATAANPGGTKFIAGLDVSVEGAAREYRVYFDRNEANEFHFLDRSGRTLTLGLSEGGVEQILARAALPEDAKLVRIARQSSQIGVFAGNALILSACDDRRLGGSVGLRAGGDEKLKLSAEKRGSIRFADDFMGGDQATATWVLSSPPERGSFATRSLRNSYLSANAFNYMGLGHDVLSTVGEKWWENYRYEASLRGPEHAKIGMVFAYQDPKNYGLFRWSARPVDTSGHALGQGKAELVRVRDGQEQVIAAQPVGYQPNQWFHGEVRVGYSGVTVLIDGHALVSGHDAYLNCGGIGVWCDVARSAHDALDPKAQPPQINSLNELMMQHAVFDDVKVSSIDGFEEPFRDAGALSRGWLTGAGLWMVSVPNGADAGELSAETHENSKCLIGSRAWSQYEVRCDVSPGAGAGLVFLYCDESNHFIAQTDGKTLQLFKVTDAPEGSKRGLRQELVDQHALKTPLRADEFTTLTAQVRHGHISVSAGDGTKVEALEAAGLRGRVGLWAAAQSGQASARFRAFKLSFLPEPEPLATMNAVFEDETSMDAWNSANCEWFVNPQGDAGGLPVKLFWHRSQFPGDVEVSLEPHEIAAGPYEIALSVAKDGRGGNNGYVFRYAAGSPGAKDRNSIHLALLRQGEEVARAELKLEDLKGLSSLTLRRAGAYLVAEVNGKPELTWRDPEPLSGSKIAFYHSAAVQVGLDTVKIVSGSFIDEKFSRAPVEWRTAGFAIAEVTNRWQCDPRWSFFSLKNDRKAGNPAVLWSKRLYAGDVTVELFAGNKMEQERGRPYTYARDMNITIGSDGADLTKGYTFMFGGNGNTATYIYRNGVLVKEFPLAIPTEMQFHRAWFFLRVERKGGRLAFRVDHGGPAGNYMAALPEHDLVYEDPSPLGGDHVAVWTYDHAIMIGRLRISGEGGTESEDPAAEIAPLKTPYDNTKK